MVVGVPVGVGWGGRSVESSLMTKKTMSSPFPGFLKPSKLEEDHKDTV